MYRSKEKKKERNKREREREKTTTRYGDKARNVCIIFEIRFQDILYLSFFFFSFLFFFFGSLFNHDKFYLLASQDIVFLTCFIFF